MYERVPERIKTDGKLCLWRYELRDGKKTKVPYSISGKKADPSNAADFVSFGRITEAYAKGGYDGIGLMVEGPFSAIDVDDCMSDGKLTDMAQDIVEMMDSYTEISPSGKGIRIIFDSEGADYDSTRYYIQNETLEDFILDGLQRTTAYVLNHEAEFVELLTQKTQAELNRSMRDGKKELEQAQARIRKLDEIIQHLYEDKIEGSISEERFFRMSVNYEEEQTQLESRVSELKKLMEAEKESVVNVDNFISLVRSRAEIKELTAEVIREFVEKVIAGQTERIDGIKTQHIKIVWNFIGEFVPPITENEKSA